mgnify:CR=1 FL=1
MVRPVRNAMVESSLAGCDFVRLYLVTSDGATELTAAREMGFDYIFAYSLADLGIVDDFSCERKWTQLLSLDAAEDEVFAGLNRNNRYKVRRTYRDAGIEVVVDDPRREDSYAFYRSVKEADGVAPDIEEDFDSVRWINAYHDGTLAASTCWFDSGAVLRAKHIVSTRKETSTDSALVGRLTRRLFWEACLLGLSRGHRYVDLGGIDLSDDPAKRGITAFKQSFGGSAVPTYVYRYETAAWRDLAQRVRANGRVVV